MYKSYVVTGRIVEIQGNRVLTQQGDVMCSYHSRYYFLPPSGEVEEDNLTKDTIDPLYTEPVIEGIKETKWSPSKLWLTSQKKSANRI